jgi:hypothetical protein
MAMPCRLGTGGLGPFVGQVRLRRRFGYPGRIDAHERVWLTFAGIAGPAALSLNGHALGQGEGSLETDATGFLQARNELLVDWDEAGPESGLWGEVALEIRCLAYMQNVRVKPVAGQRLEVSGEVAGRCERPLELYVVAGRSTVAYAKIAATPPGTPFQLTTEVIEATNFIDHGTGPVLPVRVELVHGASVWYAFEVLSSCLHEGK